MRQFGTVSRILFFMQWTKQQLWERFQKYYFEFPSLEMSLDLSRTLIPDGYFATMREPMAKAFAAMHALEGGTIANRDENRMVGHYWLRNSALAPTPEFRAAIDKVISDIKAFAQAVHSGSVRGSAGVFKNLLVIGIGGSALGPQFVASALGDPRRDKMKLYFFDNTDPDGMDKVLASLDGGLGQTLTVVISKSGGTKETRNGMLEAKSAYESAGLKFESHVVAVTGEESELDRYAKANSWLRRFPMWDWVGGRTSETSVVGLLPAVLQGIDIDRLLSGAAAVDKITRLDNINDNPSALLALSWFFIGNSIGEKAMVILPYKDRLELFSKYLQQLIMESLGKELDCNGKVVNQGISVYGNKGSTDQHAYIQQLRDGLANFFVTFVEVLKDRNTKGRDLLVEPNVTSGDYLSGFFQGTRQALFDNNRQSVTITINEIDPFSIGMLIALYERAVGFYATLVNINAYHQPGVEAGKKAAGEVIKLQLKILEYLRANPNAAKTADQIAAGIGTPDQAEGVFKICEHLSANEWRGVKRSPGKTAFAANYRLG